MTDLEYRIEMGRLRAAENCKLFPYPHQYHEFHAGYDGTGIWARPLAIHFLCSEVEMFNWRLEWALWEFNKVIAFAIETMARENLENETN